MFRRTIPSLQNYPKSQELSQKLSQSCGMEVSTVTWRIPISRSCLRLLGKIQDGRFQRLSSRRLLGKNADNYRTRNARREYRRVAWGIDGDGKNVARARGPILCSCLRLHDKMYAYSNTHQVILKCVRIV